MVPLFRGYAFLLIQTRWYEARWSPGILGLIMDGVRPARVPDRVISELRDREKDGCVALPEEPRLKPGDQIKIIDGHLRGLEAYNYMPASDRSSGSRLLLQFLGSQRLTVLPAASVEAAS
jgi:transcriptional antiterminator RfaH